MNCVGGCCFESKDTESMQTQIENGAKGCLTFLLDLLFGEKDSFSFPYKTRDSLLTPAERDFYLALLKAVANKAVIIPKVGLQDVFYIANKQQYLSARNRIAQRHIDFLVCEENTLRPLFGIELDDGSHNEEAHKKRDEFKNKIFEAASLPLIRMPVKQKFDAAAIRESMRPYLKFEETSEAIPSCPKCGIPMVRRTAKQGAHVGKDFFACLNYPACHEIINIPA
jgi:hypothetical protein